MALDKDVPAWAKAHQVAFDVQPLVEARGSEKIQVGFTLDLYARLPMDKTAGAERRDAGALTWSSLRELLDSALAETHPKARVDVEPMRAAAVLRPENEMKPEITLRARITHAADTWEAVTPGERQELSTFEKKLLALGLKQGHW